MQLATSLPRLPEAAQTPLGSEVYRGLSMRPKTLAPWLFYDAEGSRLFEQITELPEYYLTRTERAIFETHADEIIAAASDRKLGIIELGAGTAAKTGLLLAAAVRRQKTVTYTALDVSEAALRRARESIEAQMPEVTVETRTADYTEGLGPIAAHGRRRLVLYIGSSIGNFEPKEAVAVLRGIRRQIATGDKLLLGADMAKDRTTLRRAYDDTAGVTAAFNKNVLVRLNRELNANFNVRLFRHRAYWNVERCRIEMHLESLLAQRITIPPLELTVHLTRGETIHTENSYKFTEESLTGMLRSGGFAIAKQWTDRKQWFSVTLATAV